jgi:hypothetical protein
VSVDVDVAIACMFYERCRSAMADFQVSVVQMDDYRHGYASPPTVVRALRCSGTIAGRLWEVLYEYERDGQWRAPEPSTFLSLALRNAAHSILGGMITAKLDGHAP